MKRVDVPRLLVAGLNSGAGKTTLTLALVYELRRRGVQVSAALTGPNLQVAALLERITGRSVMCLDPSILSKQQLLEGLDRAATGAELLIIDGSAGVLDTADGRAGASDADFSALTHTPVLLVVDVRAQGSTLGAAVRGVQQASRGVDWIGVALNRLSPGLEGRGDLVAAFEHFKAPPALISLPQLDPAPPVLPNLVSQITNTTLLDRHFLTSAAESLIMGSDVEQVIARASAAPTLECEIGSESNNVTVRIGLARDSCFGLLFQDNIELLRRGGAEICEFSPLSDSMLPKDIHGLYFPGGFVGEYGAELALNEPMRAQIAAFLARGGGLYAEGAALAYFADHYRAYQLEGEFPGIGVFPAKSVPNLDGSSALKSEGALLEPSVLGESGELIRGIYPFDWKFDRHPPLKRILRIVTGKTKPMLEGYAPSTSIFGSFGLLHFGSCPNIVQSMIHAFSVAHHSLDFDS